MEKIIVSQLIADHIEKYRSEYLDEWVYNAIGGSVLDVLKDEGLNYTQFVSAIENGYRLKCNFEIGDIVVDSDNIIWIVNGLEPFSVSAYISDDIGSERDYTKFKLLVKAENVIKE